MKKKKNILKIEKLFIFIVLYCWIFNINISVADNIVDRIISFAPVTIQGKDGVVLARDCGDQGIIISVMNSDNVGRTLKNLNISEVVLRNKRISREYLPVSFDYNSGMLCLVVAKRMIGNNVLDYEPHFFLLSRGDTRAEHLDTWFVKRGIQEISVKSLSVRSLLRIQLPHDIGFVLTAPIRLVMLQKSGGKEMLLTGMLGDKWYFKIVFIWNSENRKMFIQSIQTKQFKNVSGPLETISPVKSEKVSKE